MLLCPTLKCPWLFFGRVLALGALFLSVMGGALGCSTQVKTEARYDTGKKKREVTYRKWWWSSESTPVQKTEYHFNQHPKFKVQLKDSGYHGKAQTWWMNGRLKSEGEYKHGKKWGRWIQYFEVRGDMASRGYYKNGLRHGKWESWWPKFIRKSKGQYKNDKPTGRWMYWDRAERLAKTSTCFADVKWGSVEEYYPSGRIKIKRSCYYGKTAGQYHEFFPDSSLKIAGEYNRDSRKKGVWIQYHPNGKLQSRERYTDGLWQDSIIHWDSLGNILKMGVMDSGTGALRHFFPNGSLQHIKVFKNGVQHGKQKQFYSFGKLKSLYVYEMGKPLKYWRWHADSASGDSVLTIHGGFKNGLRDGVWNWYTDKGVLVEMASYEKGKRHGEARFYNPASGKLIRIQRYERGVETTATLHNF